jgi:radical SAM superfamily enzyme YgiQ (UPF0313 family)
MSNSIRPGAKTVLVSVNASFSHTPLALYALKGYYTTPGEITLASFTLSQPDDYMLRCLYNHKPEVLGFSCYIWNIETVLRLACALRRLLPDTFILFGGPEMAAEYEGYLNGGIADAVVPGEGEKPLADLLRGVPFTEINGLVYKTAVAKAPLPTENELLLTHPFPYPPDFNGLEHKTLYYEASRGCPFRCAYCTSQGKELRHKPLSAVFNDLTHFINAKALRVKFTDRTFNAREGFAMEVWRFLAERDNGVTCFHFEIAADLLSGEALAFLARARAGLFQFEIGVQSTNAETLKAVNRQTNLPRLFENVKRLKAANNIHLHLDLIAGLPYETLESLAHGFNAVYGLQPHHIQLGFLKLLKGTPLRENAAALGLVYAPHPPYEILSTPHMPYDDLLVLKAVAKMLKVFYNGGKFTYTLRYLGRFFPTAFAMYGEMANFWHGNGYDGVSHGKIQLYEILHTFAAGYAPNAVVLKDLLRFDLLLNENEKSLPHWLSPNGERSANGRKVPFDTDILSWLGDTRGEPAALAHVLAFTYPLPGRQSPLTALERVAREW